MRRLLRLAENPARAYRRWIRRCEDNRIALVSGPRISVLMPVCDPPPACLARAIESVRAQTYRDWELCIADDASTSSAVRDLLARLRDPRIRVTFCPRRGGISSASNAALALASGEFIALLDHDDELDPHALAHLAQAVLDEPQANLLYSDEDKIDLRGRRFDPFFKPDWSPDLLLSENYVCHLLAARRALVNQAGGFRPEFDGSQDYDLTLRLSALARRIVHLPRVLYHWRSVPGSAAAGALNKPDAIAAAGRALAAHLAPAASVEPGLNPGRWRVRYPIPESARVSIIIASGGSVDVLRTNLDALAATDYRNYEIVVIDNSKSSAIEDFLRDRPVRYLDWRNKPFNYPAINNHAAAQCDAPLLLFLNDDTEALAPGWLTALVEHACRPEVGAVGAKLIYPDGRIQHGGVVMGLYGHCGHAFKGLHAARSHYFSLSDVVRNVSAVTGACLMTRAAVFREAGGFDEAAFPVAFNDIDLCLKIGALGYRILYTPHAQLRHHEAFSKTAEDLPPSAIELARLREKWKDVIARDPYYNPNLTTTREDYGIE